MLLFCHGNAGNISHRLESVEVFHRLGLSVLLFDYRGYGQSTGRPSENGLYRDGEAAWRYLRQTRRVDSLDVILYGRSLGGAVATYLAAQHRSGALIVESAFTSVPDVAARHYPYLPVRALARTRFDNLGVFLGHMIGQDLGSHRGADAGGGQVVFDSNGYAVQRAAVLAPHQRRFLLLGLSSGLVVEDGDKGIQHRLEPVYPSQGGLG